MHGPSVIEAVERSTLDLLDLRFAYSQTDLMTPSQFIRAAEERGVRLEHSELEAFHRAGVLVPFYRVHERAVMAPMSLPSEESNGGPWQVFQAAQLGQLSDAITRRSAPWPRRRGPTGVYYSQYQLLGLRALALVMSRSKLTRAEDGDRWSVPKLNPRERSSFASDRSLAVVLEALSSRYRPRVMEVLKSPSESLWDYVNSHDAETEHEWLDLPAEVLLRQADVLLSTAKFIDPMGEWKRVVRIGKPERWKGLRGEALVAQDMRVAAEMLLRFVEDEASAGRAAELRAVSSRIREPQHDRLKVTTRERADTLLDFGLSDRPALIVILEGQTEVRLASRLLEMAGFETFNTWVELVDLEGVNGDLRQLARALAVPRVDAEGHVGARLAAPLSAVFVATDPEGKSATDADRVRRRDEMIEAVVSSLPDVLRTNVIREELEHLIFVRSWPQEFEFAHFTDAELARAIRSVVPAAPPHVELKQQLAKCRARRGTINDVWKKWPRQPSKVALADELWPALERRVRNERYGKPIPLVDLLEEALRVAHDVRHVREVNVK